MAATSSGCNIYFDDDDDDDCAWGDSEPGAAEAPPSLRDPYTGQCVDFGWGGGGGGGCGCDEYCPPPPIPPVVPPPPWGACYSQCSGLDETSCLATPGCRGGYLAYCLDAANCGQNDPAAGYLGFYECWAVDTTGPIQGSCDNLDAWTCSQHDDCIAIHDNTCNVTDPPPDGSRSAAEERACSVGNFLACAAESPTVVTGDCLGNGDCDAGYYCNNSDLTVCLPPPDGSGGGAACPPDGADCEALAECWGQCVYVGEQGECYGDVFCASPPPPCADSEVAGVLNGCWSGLCIPLSQCEAPPCTWLGENDCLDRADCEAYYQGVDCTCDQDGNCTCADWAFTVCLGDGDAPPPGMGSDPRAP